MIRRPPRSTLPYTLVPYTPLFRFFVLGINMAVAGIFAVACAVLPGDIRLVAPDPVESVDAAGRVQTIERGAHLHLRVRPAAPVQLLLTGHMDTVFAADHPFQSLRWIEDGALNGPGTADMKGGLAVILAALTALEASPPAPRVGYDVLINKIGRAHD